MFARRESHYIKKRQKLRKKIRNLRVKDDGTETSLTFAVRDGNLDIGPWATEEQQQILIERYESRND